MKLLLLTSKFPYPSGEQFLETEILVLASIFEEVLIVPINISPKMQGEKLRSVPSNVKILSILNEEQAIKLLVRVNLVKFICTIVSVLAHINCFQIKKIYTLFRKTLRASLIASFITKTIDLTKYNVFYSYWGAEIGLTLSVLTEKITFSKKQVFVTRLHGFDLYAERNKEKKIPYQKKILECCDLVCPCSKQGEKYLKGNYPIFSHKIKHFYLGVASHQNFNSGSADGILRIVSCSFVIPVKRLELLVDALRNVERKVIWTHIGDGPEFDRIKSLLSLLPLQISPIFIGHLDNKEVLNFYKKNPVDLFVNVSSSEGVPVSIMEALSFGIEIVATDVGGVKEIVDSSFGTLLDPFFKPIELTRIIQNHKNCLIRKKRAKKFQQKKFSTNNYEKFIETIIKI